MHTCHAICVCLCLCLCLCVWAITFETVDTDVMMGLYGQFNRTQRLTQISSFHGFYIFCGLLLNLPRKWFKFGFRFTK